MTIDLEQIDDGHLRAANEGGGTLSVDISEGPGGESLSPMQLVATGLGGCSSVDVLSILKKQRQQVEAYRVQVEGQRAVDQVPAVFEALHLIFHIDGDVAPEKARRAVELSLEKYCSVARMLEKTADITFTLIVNGSEYTP